MTLFIKQWFLSLRRKCHKMKVSVSLLFTGIPWFTPKQFGQWLSEKTQRSPFYPREPKVKISKKRICLRTPKLTCIKNEETERVCTEYRPKRRILQVHWGILFCLHSEVSIIILYYCILRRLFTKITTWTMKG